MGSVWPAVAFWGAVASVVLVYPLASGLISAILYSADDGLSPWRVSWVLLATSVGWALGVGVLSALIAFVGAWASRGWRAWWTPVLVLPILMPSSLVSSALNLLRAPGTPIGDWLAMGPSVRPMLVGRALAVVGLSLWASPLAQLVLAAGVRTVDPTVLEAARLSRRGPWGWIRLRLALSRRFLPAAIGVVGVLMLGSAVPMHLAQMDTYALRLWLELDVSGPDGRWRVLAASWPMVGIASVAAGALVMLIARPNIWPRGMAEVPSSRWSVGVALLVPVVAVVLPAALYAMDLDSPSTLSTLWRTESGAIMTSLMVSACVSLVSVGVAAAVWIGLGGDRWARRTTLVGVFAALVMGLLPGVVVGAMVGDAWRGVPAIEEHWAVLVLAHLARFLVVPAVVGVLLAWSEPSEDRDLRVLFGAVGPIGWARTVGWRAAMALASAGLVAGALSFNEIESAVMVIPPGMQSLARVMLDLLHYQRYEHLSGLSLIVVCCGMLLAAGSAVLWGMCGRAPR